MSSPIEIDLTEDDPSDFTPASKDDHMHAVMSLLDPGCTRDSTRTSRSAKKRRISSSEPKTPEPMEDTEDRRRKPTRILRKPSVLPDYSDLQNPTTTSQLSILQPTGLAQSPPRLQTLSIGKRKHHKPLKTFPLFLSLPPELRNTIYRFLLLTNNHQPIELPRLTGTVGRRRAAEWSRCDTSSKRRRHKVIFLEILQTCRQVYLEATGIVYGENVFKFRCNPSEPAPPRYAPSSSSGVASSSLSAATRYLTLPPRALPLLKNVKVSVLSHRLIREPRRITDLLSCFAMPDVNLDSFEFTWFGFEKCLLGNGDGDALNAEAFAIALHGDGVPNSGASAYSGGNGLTTTLSYGSRASDNTAGITAALLAVRVSKEFKVKVLGQAVMTETMQRELQAEVHAEQVEIQRRVGVEEGLDVLDGEADV